MFGRSKPVVFDRYASRRTRWRIPPWLVLLVVGAAAGVAGVLWVQTRYLPPTLSAAESAQLRASLADTQAERDRLQRELAETTKRLDATLSEKTALANELAGSRQAVDRLRADVSTLVASLPPDPRGGAVQIRAARFASEPGKLSYDIVLSRDRATRPISGVMQLVVSGAAKRGSESSVKLKPIDVSVGSVQSVHGEAELPDGFDARQATVNVLDRPAGKLLGMRVMLVK